MNKLDDDLKRSHRRILIQEALDGKIKKDTLPNSAFEFSGSLLATYSSRTRIFMNSVLAHMIMDNHKDKVNSIYDAMNRDIVNAVHRHWNY